jgi:rod shape-determining protein MreC
MNIIARRRIVIIALIGGILVVLGSIGRLGPIGTAIGVVASPISRVLYGVGVAISGEFSVVGSARTLARDNAALKKENADLRSAFARASASAAELAAIKNELGLQQNAGKRLVPADVVSTQPDSYRSYITINRGKTDGILVGMVVVLNGTLVGKVDRVDALTSKVLVVTDPTFKVAGQVLGPDEGATGIVRGSIGGGMIMEKIPQDKKISTGDTVITSGLGGDTVKGYSLGTIQTITRADNGVFQMATVATPIQLSNLQTIFVVTN